MTARHAGPAAVKPVETAALFGIPLALLAFLAVAIYLAVSIRTTRLELTIVFGVIAVAQAAVWIALWRENRRFPWARAATGLAPALTLAIVLAPSWRWILLSCDGALFGAAMVKMYLDRYRQQRPTPGAPGAA